MRKKVVVDQEKGGCKRGQRWSQTRTKVVADKDKGGRRRGQRWSRLRQDVVVKVEGSQRKPKVKVKSADAVAGKDKHSML